MKVTKQIQQHFNKLNEDDIATFRIQPRTRRTVLKTNEKVYNKCNFSVLDDCVSHYC